VARRARLDPDRDLYPSLIVSAVLGATRVAITVWQERDRPGRLTPLLDEAFDRLAAGFGGPAPRPTLTGVPDPV
jgi:hypothetical protein